MGRSAGGFVALLVTLAAPARAAAQPQAREALASEPLTLILVVAFAALLPFAFMSLTAFVKISTVLQIVRGAIGIHNIPTNTVVIALAGALTVIAMAPVGSRIATGLTPVLANGDATASELITGVVRAAREPMRDFLEANASERERKRFFDLARSTRPIEERDGVGRDDLVVVIPAFVVTELIEAFALGFAIYLPFLVIDLVVSNVLLSLGMQMMNPSQVSLPFKLLLFVAVDGWGLLAQALVTGYAPG